MPYKQMTLEQDELWQLYSAIVQGNCTAASELLCTQDPFYFLTKKNNYGFCPALFGLWAIATRDTKHYALLIQHLLPEAACSMLAVSNRQQAALVQQWIFPPLKSSHIVLEILKMIGPQCTFPIIADNDNYIFINITFEALGYLLNLSEFDNMSHCHRVLATDFYTRLSTVIDEARVLLARHHRIHGTNEYPRALPEVIKDLLQAEKRRPSAGLSHFTELDAMLHPQVMATTGAELSPLAALEVALANAIGDSNDGDF